MELPFSLRTLPPEAIDILRFFGANGSSSVHADDITQGAGLSDRGFGKAIRRLVTKGMLVMDGDQVYRLSDAGKRSVAELLEYDLSTPPNEREMPEPVEMEPRFVRRRVVLAAPNPLPAGQPAQIAVGLAGADDDEVVMLPLHVLVRLGMMHGEPEIPQSLEISVENRPAQHHFSVTAGAYQQARLRLQICQSDDGAFDKSACGGMVVDLPVGASAGPYAAFGVDVMLKDTSGDSFDLG